ncbi:MAG TPA: histidine kinase dimerization/phospho-acceptor domain-containing protein, partial [Chthonomonadales bacterium]|nr:histidine kinase dimerization/phospho-acceptor domain-containing protein [Chthonomonadales bacterium]
MSEQENSEVVALRRRIESLEHELQELRQRNADLERVRAGSAQEIQDLSVPISEFEETLRRLVQRTAMIVQAEKCVIMVRERDSGDLVARSPAFGMTEEDVAMYRVAPGGSIAGDVFLSGHPEIFADALTESRAPKELFRLLRVRNGVTVPLIIEKRDDQNHLVDRVAIGVLHCFNKRYGGEFNEEDVRLLDRLSRNAAAVIGNAQMFRDLLEERQKLVHTLENLTAGLLLISHQGRIARINAQARAMFDVTDDQEPIGKPYAEVIHHEGSLVVLRRQLEHDPEPQEEPQEEERRGPEEITLLNDDGDEFTYQVHAAAVSDDDDKPIGTVFIFNDITDIRNVERMKTEFVSIVSHELRTPLTPMKGFVRTLLDDENEELYTREDRREFYGIIDANVDRLHRLINDLLNVSRIEKVGVEGIEMSFEEVDLADAV